MKEKEKPRFFCDNCGKEVEQDAQGCSNCGRSFLSVRCPSCGLTGEAKLFDLGCPACGYSTKGAPGVKKSGAFHPVKEPKEKEAYEPVTLPVWVYVVTGAIFIGVLTLMYYFFN